MRDGALFILLGQSNAVGHGLPMAPEDRIVTPLTHVWGLSRAENQRLDVETLRWSGYVSTGMNLGESQDDTYSLPNCLAVRWQAAIDAGEPLPDLYIVQIAIGAQGVSETYMWYPTRAPKLVAGDLHTADISLYPFTRRVLSRIAPSFAAAGKSFDVIGIHWRGGEEDTTREEWSEAELSATITPIYRDMVRDFRVSLAPEAPDEVPFVFHRLACVHRMKNETQRAHLQTVNESFAAVAGETAGVSVFDPRTAPFYRADTKDFGIFKEDFVHFTRKSNEWIAERILAEAAARLRLQK